MEGAVVSSTEGVLRVLLGKLSTVLAEKYVLLRGVGMEIVELKDDLESMNACLRDLAAGGDYRHSEQTRTWMKQVREVAYDAEDCIDTFWHHNGQEYRDTNLIKGFVRRIMRPLKTLRAMHALAMEIRDLQTRALKVSERRLRYTVDAGAGDGHAPHSSPEYNDLDRRLPALNIDESRLVGMSEKTKEVTQLLEDGNSDRLKVVSIVGFGGLGKTTLAMTLYKNPALKGIQAQAFIAVSLNYDLRILLQSLLKQLIQIQVNESGEQILVDPLNGIETWQIDQLMEKCQNHLSQKRYFIIVDDLWRREAWEKVKVAFPDNRKKSIILITTRNRDVAQSCCSNSYDRIYNMKPLPPTESRKLFFNKVFQSDACPYDDLMETSDRILRKCNNLPLAIVNIGGMLARTENKTRAEWEKLCERLGSGLETSATLAGMRRILSFGYHDLPYHLKACFLYLSVYPEDYEIKRGPLVRQWEAEGFLSGRHESNLEEVAERYLDEFVNRSIITPTRIASTGVVRCCKVHDMMLEVIMSRSIQENFISFIGSRQQSAIGHDRIRRLSIRTDGNGNGTAQDEPDINFSHCRSLSILGCSSRPKAMASFAQKKLLRVLDLEGCGWLTYEDLKDICKMYLLRYLCLRRTNVSNLPKQIGRLKNLVTLDVRETSIGELPETITQLEHLKHLLGGRYRYYTRMSRVKLFEPHEPALKIPRGMKNMKALQKIAHLDIGSSFRALEELGSLSQITKLCAINLESGGEKWVPFAAALKSLCNSVRHLSIIHWYNGDPGLEEIFLRMEKSPVFLEKLFLWGKLSALPEWILSLNYLVDLSLRENFLGGDLLIKLGKLQSLVSLKLYHESFIGTRLCFEQDQFPRLKQLVLDNLPNLDELSFQGGASNLEKLTLAFKREPRIGIIGIETNLPELKEVEFFGETIIDSLVDTVMDALKIHPNEPRVYITATGTSMDVHMGGNDVTPTNRLSLTILRTNEDPSQSSLKRTKPGHWTCCLVWCLGYLHAIYYLPTTSILFCPVFTLCLCEMKLPPGMWCLNL